MLKKQDFYFDLPEELIAQTPLEDRSSSRLMVMDRETGEIEHKHFRDITEYLNEGDCLVLNETKVLPARLIGARKDTGTKVEVLLLKRLTDDTWETLVYPGKKARVGHVIEFGDGLLEAEVVDIVEEGNRVVKFHFDGIFEELLDKLGQMPLLHILKKSWKIRTVIKLYMLKMKVQRQLQLPAYTLHHSFFNSLKIRA